MKRSILQHPKPGTQTIWEFDLESLAQSEADRLVRQFGTSLVVDLKKKSFTKPYQLLKALYQALPSAEERHALTEELADFRMEKRGGHPNSGRKPTGKVRKNVTLTLSPKAVENMHKLPNASKFVSDYLESSAVLRYIESLQSEE